MIAKQYKCNPMKKIIALAVTALVFLTPTAIAWADEQPVLQTPSDYKVTEVAAVPSATSFALDFLDNQTAYIFSQIFGKQNLNKVVKVSAAGESTVLLDHTTQSITNMAFYRGDVYLVSRGQIYIIKEGKIFNLINGLPTYGDNANSNVIFNNGEIYFGVGTATNSGIVGPDNTWLASYPSVRDVPCASIKLSGVNITANNFLTAKKNDQATTGSFMPYNVPASAGQTVRGSNKCNGAIIKASASGGSMQVYAWGLHNPKSLSFDDAGRLWVLDGGMQDLGVRPVKGGADSLHAISQGAWYGWPDFNLGQRIEAPAILDPSPAFPPVPTATWDLGQVSYFLAAPDRFLSASGLALVGDRQIKAVALGSSELKDFISLTDPKAKITQMKFGLDDKLYVLVSMPDHKTSKLFSVESTRPVPVAGLSRDNHTARNNWILGSMLAILAGGSFYSTRFRQKAA